MFNGIALNNIQNAYVGSTPAQAIYIESTLIWTSTPHDYSQDYLTFEALENTTFTFSINDLQYSLDDGTTWITLQAGTATPTVSAGNKILWKQTGLTPSSNIGIGTFSATGNFNASGNIMSLYYGDNFVGQTSLSGKNDAFYKLFYYNTKLVNAENFILPATTLANYCYQYMFYGCSSLTAAPELPAITLTSGCYYSMFTGCQSLTTAPELPATTLVNYCYYFMFYGCTSLTTAPELPANTLTQYCYQHMFKGCSNLNYIKCLATISAFYSTNEWVDGVAASGTFVKDATMSGWSTGSSGIPSGWSVIDAPHDYSQDHLTFEALESGNITWKALGTSSPAKTISYSINGGAWTSISSSSAGTNISVSAGDKVRFKGNESSYATSNSVYSGFENQSGAKFNIYGNIMSLIYGDNFIGQTSFNGGTYNLCSIFKKSNVVSAENLILPATTLTDHCYRAMFSNATLLEKAPELPATTLAEYCYYYMFENTKITTAPILSATSLATYCYGNMFRGCTSLTTAPVLPATTLVERCYDTMFRGCTSLVIAPALPATTLAGWCYGNMFRDCTSLATAPALPATTLADSCYQYMFHSCTLLTKAPELPATTLVNNCYQYMFSGCRLLNYIKCLATNPSGYTTSWVQNVAPSGTFVKDANTTWTTGNSGIPSGWTVYND